MGLGFRGMDVGADLCVCPLIRFADIFTEGQTLNIHL